MHRLSSTAIHECMKELTPKSIFILCLFALTVGCSDRKVLQEIPFEIRGVWVGMYSDPEVSLIIERGELIVINREHPAFLCKAEEIVSYKAGWILQERKTAVICDKASTDNDQKEDKKLGIITPAEYRKTFYFSVPNKLGAISVSHTKFMSRGWSGSEGTYEWDLDDFYKR